jgi:GNAT superfamily N-acetyltransferase
MSAIPALTISPATPADVPLILQLIRELADFEHLSHEAVASEQDIERGLFGERAHAEVLIARRAAEPLGFALFFHNFSTFVGKPGIYLEDLYVRPQARGQGVGTALLRQVAALACQRGCGRFEWSVLNWNQRAIDFYRKLGARPMDEWTVFRLSGEALKKLGSP